MIYLLDNNVLSELWKEKPDPNVRAWFFSSDWFLPVPVIAEIQEVMPTLPPPSYDRDNLWSFQRNAQPGPSPVGLSGSQKPKPGFSDTPFMNVMNLSNCACPS